MRYFFLTLMLGLGIVLPCQAGIFARSCAQCGCCQLKKVCRMVPDVKKVTEIKYTVDEEDVCLLGKSGCQDVVVPDECAPNGQRCDTVQVPQCGRIVCKKKLKKTTTTVEKPSVKCVVETICCGCGANCGTGNCSQ